MSDLDQVKNDHGGEKGVEPMFGCGPGTVLKVEGQEVNASGHRDQLQRQYSIWSICGLALTIDNAWVALGGSIVVAIGMLRLHAVCRRQS